MAVVTDSFLELVNKLCSKHVEKQRTHSFLVQKPTHSRTNVQKRLKIAAYDTLYAYLRGTPRYPVFIMFAVEILINLKPIYFITYLNQLKALKPF